MPAKLKDQLFAHVRTLHYSGSTAKTYWSWIDKYIRFNRRGATWIHPAELGERDVERYLSWLAKPKTVRMGPPSQGR